MKGKWPLIGGFRRWIARLLLGRELYERLQKGFMREMTEQVQREINGRLAKRREEAKEERATKAAQEAMAVPMVDLYVRAGKGKYSFLQKVGEAPIPDSADWIKVPTKQDFSDSGIEIPSHSMLTFHRMKMQKECEDILGKMFICNLSDDERRGMSV